MRVSALVRSLALASAALAVGAAPAAAQRGRHAVPQVDAGVARVVPPSPAPEGFIADVPGLVRADARAALNARIRELQRAGLGDVGVAIIPSLGGYTPAEVGVGIYRTWRIGRIDTIGSARRDLGALLLIVPKELAPDHRGQCWITTGTGAEGAVTDAASGTICRDRVIPHLKSRDYAAAVGAGLDGIEERLRADAGLTADTGASTVPRAIATTPAQRPSRGPWWLIAGGAAGLVGAGGLAAATRWWRRNRPRRCPRCGKPMTRLDETADDAALEPGQRVEERLHSVDYDVWSCACGGALVVPYRKLFTRYHECTTCHRRTCRSTRLTLSEPTYSATGLAEETHTCEACGAHWSKRIVLPVRTRDSGGSGGSGGGGGGGGGGFGGSGSTSGGGGGSSY